ncbi:Uncharacterized protein TCM_005374 [Theobroma cacao]|uniref:Uncharacterized protein n=1 Tax=Theobroma cacao TaxID=3641 RepID=A0A061E163_THECC|nr:Uncharacterized protein TCM_005374 [Theobroma cacao]
MQNHVEIPATADQNLAGNLDVFGFNAPFFFLFFRAWTSSFSEALTDGKIQNLDEEMEMNVSIFMVNVEKD